MRKIKFNKLYLIIIAISVVVILTVFNFSGTDFSLTEDFRNINMLEFSVSRGGDFISYPLGDCKDPDLKPKSIPFQHLKNGAYYYNPVSISQYGLRSWRMWKCSGSKVHKEDFIASADWLVENIEIKKNGIMGGKYGIWLYEFDFCLHGVCKEEETMKSPWISGMAQGRAISVLSRAYKATKELKYLKTATLGMNAFLNVYDGQKKNKNWITYIDRENKNIWIEEYPMQEIRSKNNVNFTLNGFNFA